MYSQFMMHCQINIKLMVEPGIEPGTSWLVVRSSDHQATRMVRFCNVTPCIWYIHIDTSHISVASLLVRFHSFTGHEGP